MKYRDKDSKRFYDEMIATDWTPLFCDLDDKDKEMLRNSLVYCGWKVRKFYNLLQKEAKNLVKSIVNIFKKRS